MANFILEWARISPFTLFIAICASYYLLKYVLFVFPNRVLRSISIARHGWPPAHCDADGDLKDEEEEQKEGTSKFTYRSA